MIKHSVEVPHPNKIKSIKYLKKNTRYLRIIFFYQIIIGYIKIILPFLKAYVLIIFIKKYQIISTGTTFDHRHPDHFLNIKKFIETNDLTESYKILELFLTLIWLVNLSFSSSN